MQHKAPAPRPYGEGPSGPASFQRDPQVLVDPSGLAFNIPQDSFPQDSLKDAFPGVVNPNVVYTNHTHTVYIPQPVIREQYCKCAPETPAERRLLVAVIVLAIVAFLLLAALGSIIPLATGDDDDDKDPSKPKFTGDLFSKGPLQVPIQLL